MDRLTIQAREVVIIATGTHKAAALQQSIELGVSSMSPLSSLQLHQRAMIVADDPATLELKVKTVKYYKSTEAVAALNGLAQIICPQVEEDETRRSVGEELDSTSVPSPVKRGFLTEPERVGIEYMRVPTPELLPDRMASRMANGFVNELGGLDGMDVQLESMSSRVAPLAA
jgi:glucosamine-6-phosphate deaminase